MLEKNEIQNLLDLFTHKKYQEILDKKEYLKDSFPNSINIYNILGLTHYAKNEFQDAVICFSKAIKLSPNFNEEISYNLAIVLIAIKEFKSALSILKNIEDKNPSYSKVYFQIGILYFRQNYFQDAIKYFEKSISLKTRIFSSMLNIAYCHESQGERLKAEKMLKKISSEIVPNQEEIKDLKIFMNKILSKDSALCLESKYPIELVIATKSSSANFFKQTLTGKSLTNRFTRDIRLNLFADNINGLPKVYNKFLDQQKKEDSIIVFLHDDIFFHDIFWAQKIEESLNKYDVVGLVGCKKRDGDQPSWYFKDIEMNTISSEQASGIVSHGNENEFNTSYFGPSDQRVEILDGLLIAVKLSTLREHKIRFDERFKFHFYDVDFCRMVEEKKLICGTAPISVIHKSDGVYDDIWRQSFSQYKDKWASRNFS